MQNRFPNAKQDGWVILQGRCSRRSFIAPFRVFGAAVATAANTDAGLFPRPGLLPRGCLQRRGRRRARSSGCSATAGDCLCDRTMLRCRSLPWRFLDAPSRRRPAAPLTSPRRLARRSRARRAIRRARTWRGRWRSDPSASSAACCRFGAGLGARHSRLRQSCRAACGSRLPL
jgi:hypothetical protein